MPTFATAQLKSFFDCGRAVRCMLPLGFGRFMHLVVLSGYHWADHDPEQLALTEHLFDAALSELSVVARGQPCLMVVDFNVESTKIPCLAKGISAGLWVDFEEAWALAAGSQPLASGTGLLVVIVWILWFSPLAAAAVLSCRVQPGRWIALVLILLLGLFLTAGGHPGLLSLSRRTPLWPASWLPALDKSRGSESVEVQRVWEVYDERLQFISRQDAILRLVMFLVHGLSGLGLLRLLLLTLIGSAGVLSLAGVWFLGVLVLCFGLLGLVVTRCGRLVAMFLMRMTMLVSSCIVIFCPWCLHVS